MSDLLFSSPINAEDHFKGMVFKDAADSWRNVERPGYFGRRRDMKIAAFDEIYGKDGWRLAWVVPTPRDVRYDGEMTPGCFTFDDACQLYYEESYVRWLQRNPADLEFACTYGECIDNAPSNVESGLDYMKQESYSTHIQDIAMRNALKRLDRKFEGPADKILVIRSADSDGFRFGPGNIQFRSPDLIIQPSKCPQWANAGSVEDFWQSNKWLQAKI